MKPTFLNSDKPLLTVMVQADNPKRVMELMDKAEKDGAEAFGMQFCRMKPEFRNRDTYKALFAHAKGKPVYVTNYKIALNEHKTCEQLGDELVELAECGATLCDVVGDWWDKQPDELAKDETAIAKQMQLIERLHKAGAEVLMSSHINKFTPAEYVIKVAQEHKRRGADICKIVTGADTMAEQIENMKIVNTLKEELRHPFLFLSVGECSILRRIGGELGCCMYLCVQEYDALATPTQPLLKRLKAIRDNIRLK